MAIMKAVLCLLSFTLLIANAQSQTIPSNPLVPGEAGGTSKRNLGGGGDIGVATGAKTDTSKRTVVINYVAVTPLKDWTNLDGKTIKARILAFSAPKPDEEGPVEVIRDGKVRLLIPGKPKPIDYPLSNLTRAHRDEIERIAKAAAAGAPQTDKKAAEAGS